MPGPADLFAQIEARDTATSDDGGGGGGRNAMLAQMLTRKGPPPAAVAAAAAAPPAAAPAATATTTKSNTSIEFGDQPYVYDVAQEAFLFAAHCAPSGSERLSSIWTTPSLATDAYGNAETDIVVPLAACVYRMTDYTYAKKEPVSVTRCVLKLGVLRCLARECRNLNNLLWHRLDPAAPYFGSMEEDELGKTRFMELLSNCGVYQKVSEIILTRAGKVTAENKAGQNKRHRQQQLEQPYGDSDDDETVVLNDKPINKNPCRIPQVRVDGLEEFLAEIEKIVPALAEARREIDETQMVSFYPGLGELFTPGSKLTCFPDGTCACGVLWLHRRLLSMSHLIKTPFLCLFFPRPNQAWKVRRWDVKSYSAGTMKNSTRPPTRSNAASSWWWSSLFPWEKN